MEKGGQIKMNHSIRGEGDSPALLPGSLLLASGVAVYGLVTQVVILHPHHHWGMIVMN